LLSATVPARAPVALIVIGCASVIWPVTSRIAPAVLLALMLRGLFSVTVPA
jgi:hypothetical protein